MKWVSTMWRRPLPEVDLVEADSAQKSLAEVSECSHAAIRMRTDGNVEGHVVIDVRLGRDIRSNLGD